jgi:hypothetical protein
MTEASSGKMPTTSVLRPISRLNLSSGLVGAQLGPVFGGERVERQHVVLGVLEQPGDLGEPGVELGHGVGEPAARLNAVGGGEQRADHRTPGRRVGLCGHDP